MWYEDPCTAEGFRGGDVESGAYRLRGAHRAMAGYPDQGYVGIGMIGFRCVRVP